MLDSEATILTRKHFAKIAIDCAKEAKNNSSLINPEYGLERYLKEKVKIYKLILRGGDDDSVTFQQYKNYLQTGICYPILNF